MSRHRNHKGYWAFAAHRISGLALAVFLPFHFAALSLALDEAALDGFLRLADHPLFKVAEWGLVTLLALHMAFGIRVLVLEFLPWPAPKNGRAGWILPGAGVAVLVGAAFLVRVF